MDPELLAVKDSLLKVLEAQASATKDSLGLMARRQLLEEKAIKQLAQELNVGEDKIKQELAGLKQQKQTTDAQKTFSEGLKRGAQQAIDTFTDFIGGTIAAGQSMYNTSEVFTSVIPTLQTMGNAVKGVIGALGSAFSGVPIIGGFLDASAKMAGAAISFAITMAENQLKNSQTMVNNFSAIAKTGATFGASLDSMLASAKDGGMTLSMFQSFITKNVETLGQLGGSTEQASRRVVNLAKDVAAANPKLLAMAGGMEGVANQTIEYMGAMNRMGFDTTKSNKNQAQAAADYIWNLNTLSALTGESAEKLKKEQDERLKSAGYLLKLNEMGPEAGQAMQNGISLAAAKLGPNFAKFAEEFVSTQGRVVSESAQQYQAQNQEIARNLMPQLVENSMLGGKAAATANAELLTKLAPAIESEMMRYASLMKAGLAYADASDGWIKGINENMSFFMRNKNGLLGMSDAAKTVEQQRDAKVSAEIEQYAKNIKSLTEFQIRMDELTRENLPNAGKLVAHLIKIQERMTEKMYPMLEAAVTKFAEIAAELEKALLPVIAPPLTSSALGVKPGDLKPEAQARLDARIEEYNRSFTGMIANRISGFDAGLPSGSSGGSSALAKSGAARMEELTQEAVKKMVKYTWGGGHTPNWEIGSGGVDCSGWVAFLNRKMMEGINKEAGKEIYGEKARKIFTEGGTAGTLIDRVIAAGGGVLKDSAVNEKNLTAGMMIGSKNKAWSGQNVNSYDKGIQHIAQITQGEGGQLFVSEATGDSVRKTPLSQWLKSQQAGTELIATDPTKLGDPEFVRTSMTESTDLQVIQLAKMDEMISKLEELRVAAYA
jgi:hypothetical protein